MSDARATKKPRAVSPDVGAVGAVESTPIPGRSPTVASDGVADDAFLVGAIENRAGEVGVAVFDTRRQKLLLTQFIETSRTYTTTLILLHRFPPQPLLLVEEKTQSRAGGLSFATRDVFANVSMPRSVFDDAGSELLLERLAPRATARRQGQQSSRRCHYLAIGAAGAVLTYLQEVLRRLVLPGTLDVEFLSTENHMELDLASMECLGIAKPGRALDKLTCPSLFQIMNRTKTAAGAKLLKSNLVQPLTHVLTLNCRYAAVQELVENASLRSRCGEALATVPRDMDKICSIFTLQTVDPPTEDSKPGKETAISRRISSLIDGVILMKEVLETFIALTAALQPATSDLRCSQLTPWRCQGCVVEGDWVCAVLDDQVRRQKPAALKRIEQCYAVKSGFDGFLDVARTNFCKITEQIHTLANQLQERHRLENIKVTFNSKRGFSFLVSMGDLSSVSSRSTVPAGWMVIEKKGKNAVHCVTHELIALNSRLKDATHDCMILTQQALEGIGEMVVEHLVPLRKVVDSVALLDLLYSFAELAVTSSGVYTRPCIASNGPLAISAGRHPIYEVALNEAYSPNDTFLSPFSSCHIITGPNMSGKSTYLKQVALILIMAQVGAFVPADNFLFSPCDRLFSRMGFQDSIETNSSSFMIEMQEMAHILQSATPRSLVVVDELGRATSTTDGESIAWAVSEKLLEMGTFSLIATHFPNLPYLTRLYPSAKWLQFEVLLRKDDVHFRRKLTTPSSAQTPGGEHYGLELATILSFPEALLQRARHIAEALHRRGVPPCLVDAGPEATAYRVAQKLHCLAVTSEELSAERLESAIGELQRLL